MVAAANARASQISILTVSESDGDAKLSQYDILTVYNVPADFGEVSQYAVSIVAESDPTAHVSQLDVMVVYRGRVMNPKLQSWTFPMDGHDFYVLRLGETETLVYDTYSEEWSVWGSETTNIWNALTGVNWIGAGDYTANLGSNVVVGDHGVGTLYMLDPLYPYDDDPATGVTDRKTFERVAQAQVPFRGTSFIPCYAVQLTGSFGDTYDGLLTAVTLSYSDDAGRSYVDAGTINVPSGDYAARVDWQSLGLIQNPGRLFKVVDTGSLARIDSLDMSDGSTAS